MELGSTANIPFNGINILYALGEALYSGKNLRVTLFYTFLSRGR